MRPHSESERKRERNGKGGGKKERRRKKGKRDGKLASKHFLCLVKAKLRAAGSGVQCVRISVATNPSASRLHTHTRVKLHPTVPRLVYGLHLWPDCIFYGHRQFMTHFSSSISLFRCCCSYLFPPVSAQLLLHLSLKTTSPKTLLWVFCDFIMHIKKIF